MNQYVYIIILPIITGLILFLLPEKVRTIKGIIALAMSIFTFYFSFLIFKSDNILFSLNDIIVSSGFASVGPAVIGDLTRYITFKCDELGGLILIFTSLFAFLISLYSIVYLKNDKTDNYFSYFLITLGCSYGAVLSDNLLLFLFFWGILGITLYKLIPGNNEESSATAKKTLILIGASDSIMIIGIAILWKISGTLNMSEIRLPVNDAVSGIAFFALLIGAFTKAGAFPFHTWIPDYAKDAPASSSAYLPASLDKLLGIYFLARIVTGMFIPGEWLTLILLILGVTTIIAAVMMALIQHNYKQLLGYHAVSQVGYMIVGLSLGSFIGVAAGLFHMINNALYKSGLFLSAGSIEFRTGKDNIDDLGGLSKTMPITFFAALIFAMSISGIPPLNGFASKWMIYQGIIEFGSGQGLPNKLWIIWLALAVLGSALTLASFIKFIGGIFLSRRRSELVHIKEVPPMMWIPLVILAFLCIIFGIFATKIVVPELFMPISGEFLFTGFWDSGFVSILVLVSFLIGLIIYLAFNLKRFRTEENFIGGEKFHDQTGYPTPEFYKTFNEFGFFSMMYKKARDKWFDIYDLSKKFVLWLSHKFSETHTGVLPEYVIWVFAGLIVMLLIMI